MTTDEAAVILSLQEEIERLEAENAELRTQLDDLRARSLPQNGDLPTSNLGSDRAAIELFRTR